MNFKSEKMKNDERILRLSTFIPGVRVVISNEKIFPSLVFSDFISAAKNRYLDQISEARFLHKSQSTWKFPQQGQISKEKT